MAKRKVKKTKVPTFHFAEGKRVKGITAQDLGGHLFKLKQRQHGVLKAEDVVDDALRSSSPLHHLFDWDVNRAAREHWKERARDLMRSVIVYMAPKPSAPPEPVRILVHVENDKAQGYIGIKTAMSDADHAKYMVRKALRELKSWRQRYGMYKDLQQVCQAIDKALI
jgi:hypothetical protein